MNRNDNTGKSEQSFKSGSWTHGDVSDKQNNARPLMDEQNTVKTPLKRGGKKRTDGVKTIMDKPKVPRRKKRQPMTFAGMVRSCYRKVYYVGIQVLRMEMRLRRRLRRAGDYIHRYRREHRPMWAYKRQQAYGNLLRFFTLPFREMSVFYHNYNATWSTRHNDRRPGVFVRLINRVRSWRPVFRMLVNFGAPVMAATLLMSTMYYYDNITLALWVQYEGEPLGYISHENVYTQAATAVQERIINPEEHLQQTTTLQPTYTLVVADQNQFTEADDLANRIIGTSDSTMEEANGLYIEDEFVGAVEDGNELLDYLAGVLDSYETGSENETISFIKKIELTEGLYPVTSVVSMSTMRSSLSGQENVETVHVIESGDTPTGIATTYNMPYAELQQLNPDIETASFFRVGQEVIISKAESVLATQVSRTEVYEEDIPFGTDSTPDNRYPEGQQIVVSAGVPGKQEVTANVTYIDGIEVSRVVTKTVKLSDPVNAQVLTGTQRPVSFIQGVEASSQGFIWPVDSGYFNGSLGSYWGHTGMDISGNFLSGVRASKSGTVVKSVWYGPYGNHIIIDHGNGVQTLYAHLNDNYTYVGQQVVQGELLGRVGRTGNVTGAHLHFEIRVNGRYMDPVDYIGTYKR